MTSYHLTFTAILKDDTSLKSISLAFASIHAQPKVLLQFDVRERTELQK